MNAYARWLFGAAAAFNAFIGVGLVLLRPLLQRPLGLEALSGAGLMFSYLTGLLVASMGVVYGLIAADPVRYRPLILVGALGKLLSVFFIVAPRVGGDMPFILPSLVFGDALYGLLFLHYFWVTRLKP